MPDGLKRHYGRGDLHFVTFSCYRRLPLLGSKRARGLFVKELARVRLEHGFRLAGYVVMPNHVHLLMSEPAKGTVSKALQMLKSGFRERCGSEKSAVGKGSWLWRLAREGKRHGLSGRLGFTISMCTAGGRSKKS